MIYLNNPSAVLDVTIDTNETGAKLHSSLIAITRSIVGNAWAESTDDAIEVVALTGGITNVLYLLKHKASDAKIIARLYGAGTSAFIDRGSENVVFAKLSELQFGPVFYGLFQNGRLEGFLPAVALQSDEMGLPDVVPGVATSVARLHAIEVPEIKKERWLWTKIETFVALAEATEPSVPSVPSGQGHSIHQMKEQLVWLERFVQERDAEAQGKKQTSGRAQGRLFGLETCLCHNDLLSGNILRNEQHPQVMHLIDYEYAAYNHRAFDLANHFSEYCGFEYDLERTFPSEATMRSFILEYLRCCRDGKAAAAIHDDGEEFVVGFLDAVRWMLLASHLFWGSWSTVQAATSSIDFDYAGYAQRRFAAFFLHKAAVLN